MKKTRLHIVFFLFLSLLNLQSIYAISNAQEPKQNRAFDEDFKTRYAGNRFNYEGDKIVKNATEGESKNEDSQNEKSTSIDFDFNLKFLNWFFYLALGLAVVVLVYILLNEGRSSLFSTRQYRTINKPNAITAENIENTDINTLISKAEKDHNFRLAIRYYYLLVLKTLSLKKHIKFEDVKTNAEYLNQTSKKPFAHTFAYTSYLYNYIWYGEFPLNIDEYNKAKHSFIRLLNLLK